ncbi:MAG: hypothetical protein NUV53_02015 [Patescibacteria group bacterium]|nr:hypothetical protein [Patescibacteria group bacterium]
MPKKRINTWWVVGALAVIVVGLLSLSTPAGRDDLDEFTQCLSDKGAIFYGAFWCQHCQNQKALFGQSVEKLPYVECSTSDARGRLAYCTERGIGAYPTWVFSDGSREEGEVSLERLAEKTGCELPPEK